VGKKNHVFDGLQIPPGKGVILWDVWPIEKHHKSLLWYMQQKSHNGISMTAADDCIAHDWQLSR